MSDLQIFEQYQRQVNLALTDFFAALKPQTPQRLYDAMHYAVFNGGKRVRPIFVYLCGDLIGLQANVLNPIAAAIECIHSYSLVHDDLPAMDDDDLRRGKPSTHKQFDEATAILVGDGLQAFAFEILSKTTEVIDPKNTVKIIEIFAKKVGPYGIVGGQMLDMTANNENATPKIIETIHQLKTAALFEACAASVLLAANIHPANHPLYRFAQDLGFAFQIRDDILDQTQTTAVLGKTAGKDAALGKACIDPAVNLQKRIDSINSYLQTVPESKIPLEQFSQYLIVRDY